MSTVISRSTKIVPNPDRERKAQSTLAHVTRGWIPVNPKLLHDIQQSLRDGEFDDDRSELIVSVKSDLGLLTHAAKYLRSKLDEPIPSVHPVYDLETLPFEDLSALFSASAESLSQHRLNGCTRVKSDIIRTSMVASSAAELIAVGAAESDLPIEPGSAYVGAALRNLGWNLFAWNYPDLTSSALRISRGDRRAAGKYLKGLLGYSPRGIEREDLIRVDART